MRKWALVNFLLLVAVLASCSQISVPPEQQAFYNRQWGNIAESVPVLNIDFPDPEILRVNDTYYAFATISGGKNIQAAQSKNLVEWEVLPDALPQVPAWALKGDTWAPDVSLTEDGKTYIMYFVAKSRKTMRQCIGAATSEFPAGPYQSGAAEPLICQADQGGSIDPASFIDQNEQRYILWKNDGNCCRLPTWIYIQKMNKDGLSLAGQPAQLLTTSKTWEGDLIEAPTLWQHQGKYYLFYSANAYSDERYAVGYAVADDIMGPYQKPEQPILASKMASSSWNGPGGQDIVIGLDDETYLAFHGWDKYQIKRAMYLEKLFWVDQAPSLTPVK